MMLPILPGFASLAWFLFQKENQEKNLENNPEKNSKKILENNPEAHQKNKREFD